MRNCLLILCCAIPALVAAQDSIQVTYFVGDIPTSFDTYNEVCNGPLTTLSVTLPAGDNYEVTNVHVVYQMTALGNGFKEHQRSKIRCVNTAAEETEVAGVGAAPGIMSYDRFLSIANGIYPGGTELTFEMWARRTLEDVPGCNTSVNRVNAASWTITVYHGNEIGSPRVGINTSNPVAALDVGGKIKVGDDSDMPSAGMIRWNADKEDFEGYNGTEWVSLTRNSQFGAWGSYLPVSYQSGVQFLADGGIGDRFGAGMDSDGQSLIIGSPGYDNGGSLSSGRAIIYVLNNAIWEAEDTIFPSSTTTNYQFGSTVAIGGDYAFVGSSWINPNLGTSPPVHIFKRNGSQWVEDDVLTHSVSSFGSGLDIAGDDAIIGASGAAAGFSQPGQAYIYHFNGSVWQEQDQVSATGGHNFDAFGIGVAISGDYALVGAPGIGTGGSAFVFHRSGTTWTEQEVITQVAGTAGDNFGLSVQLEGDSALIGCPWSDILGNFDQGMVYLYERDTTNWEVMDTIFAPDGTAEDLFGRALSMTGNHLLVGAPGIPGHGKSYLFRKQGTTWLLESVLLPSDGAPEDDFGIGLALAMPYIVVGAPNHDVNMASNQGKVYFFMKN